MRTRATALFACLVFGVISHAQSAGVGIKGGIQASTAKAIVLRTTPIPGATAGLYFPWGIGPMMELQPELLLSTCGSGWIEPDGEAYTERSLYFQVPLTFKYFLNNGFNLALGYQFGKPLMVNSSRTDRQDNLVEGYNNLDMGFVGGVGMDFEHGLDLSLRAYSAMTRFYEQDDALFAKHRSIQFTVGYRFFQFRGVGPHKRR